MKKYCIISGFIGAFIFIAIMVAILAWCKPFDYQAVYVVNSDITKIDSLTSTHISALKDLESKGLLLSPQEYTSHISSYYSTLVAFLIGLFVLFTIVSIWSIRILSKQEIEDAKDKIHEELKSSLAEELKDSQSFNSAIIKAVKEKMKGEFVTPVEFKELVDKQEELSVEIELINEELGIDSKSEIKSK